MSMRVHLDGSGKKANGFMALAAFAGNDDIWKKFDDDWAEILSSHVPKAKYVHMNEIARQIKGFDWKDGWTLQNSFALVNKCLMYMSHLDKAKFGMFYCGIDLDAWRKLKPEFPDLIDPIAICNRYCSEIPLTLHLLKYENELKDHDTIDVEPVHYFFDREEEFKRSFEDKWNEEKNRTEALGVKGWWDCVDEVAAVEMKKVPGVQAADILAWAVNKENTANGNLPGISLSYIMKQIIPSHYVVWDEARMREKIHLLKSELPKGATPV